MTQALIVELNLALLPEQRLANRHIALSSSWQDGIRQSSG
jgi:hypothetical protein